MSGGARAETGGPSDKPSAAVQASMTTLTKGAMGTVRIRSLAHQVDEHLA